MLVTVNIPDELAAQVQSRGLTLKSYVEGLIAEQTAMARGSAAHTLSLEEFEASLDELRDTPRRFPPCHQRRSLVKTSIRDMIDGWAFRRGYGVIRNVHTRPKAPLLRRISFAMEERERRANLIRN